MRRLARPLLYVGTVLIVVGLGRYHAQFIGHYVFHASQRLPWNLAYGVVLCTCAYGAGLPDLSRSRRAWTPAAGAAVSGAIVISVLQLLVGSLLLPRFVVFSAVLLVSPWFVVCARVAEIGRSRDAGRDRVLLVGGPEEKAALEEDMAADLEHPAFLAASLRPDEAHASGPTSKPLIEKVLESGANVIVLDRVAALDETVVGQAATLHETGVRVRSLSVFYDDWLGKLPLAELERMSLMFDVGELHRARYGRIKRLVDLVVGGSGLIALIVVTPVVLVGNMIANRGPLLFVQDRVGRGHSTFRMLKFRTMLPSETSGAWTADADERITPWGRILRRSHLDELPQVLNILKGDQSVVGPRPEQPTYVAELREKIPFYDLRHLVRPGLTGWAQVKYRYGANELDAMQKLQYDFYYLRHQSLMLDLRIIGRTFRSVAGRAGR